VGGTTLLTASKPPEFQGFSGVPSTHDLKWILGGITPVSDAIKETASQAFMNKGVMHSRRMIGLVIPWRVASPQNLAPFHQVASD
jgi:hypothetical protein